MNWRKRNSATDGESKTPRPFHLGNTWTTSVTLALRRTGYSVPKSTTSILKHWRQGPARESQRQGRESHACRPCSPNRVPFGLRAATRLDKRFPPTEPLKPTNGGSSTANRRPNARAD